MAYISTLLDSPAVVSLIDGKLLAGGGGYLYKETPPYGPTSYSFINDS